MSKPIVVLLPGRERAELREGGALPPSFFDKGRGVLLWPHDMNYEAGLEIAGTIGSRPGDVPVFFGFPRSGTPSEIKERTAEIVSVLNATMVHVVFLGDDGGAGGTGKECGKGGESGGGRKGIEYGRFHSFQALIDWCRALTKVLRTRFINEVNLHDLDSVLIVVCKGQQLQVTKRECEDFESLVGENPNGAPPDSLHPFRSCYFLNHELSVDGGDIFASSVWDIIVGRLLRAFVLSREQDASHAMWMRPGIRIWKAEECHWDVAENTANRISDAILSKIRKGLEDAVVKPDGPSVLSEPYARHPPDAVRADPDLGLDDDWSRFDPYALAGRAVKSDRRREQLGMSVKSYVEWRRGNELRGEDGEAERIFESVHDNPRQLFARSREIDDALRASAADGAEPANFRTLVGKMAETESRRRNLVAEVAGMAKEMKLAQSHYLGKGGALFIVAAVTALSGVVLWQVVTLLGGSLAAVLWLVAASALGSLAAAVAIVATHSQAGSGAAEAYAEKCRELDATSAQRFNDAREILCEAVGRRLLTRRRNARLVTSDLLERIKSVLLRELGYESSRVSKKAVAQRLTGLKEFERTQRAEYLAATRGGVQGSVAALRSGEVETAMLAKWNEENGGDLSFFRFWQTFCEDFDRANAGHLPVSELIPRLRTFMSGFANEARSTVNRKLDESCAGEKADAVREWVRTSASAGFYSARAAVNPRAVEHKRQVFVAKEERPNFFATVRASDATGSSEFFESGLLAGADAPLAFAIHEVSVRLGCDAESGVLSIGQADSGEEP